LFNSQTHDAFLSRIGDSILCSPWLTGCASRRVLFGVNVELASCFSLANCGFRVAIGLCCIDGYNTMRRQDSRNASRPFAGMNSSRLPIRVPPNMTETGSCNISRFYLVFSKEYCIVGLILSRSGLKANAQRPICESIVLSQGN
jgi:hypothetical protein